MHVAGTVLKIDFGMFFHYGIADGLGFVIHNSKRSNSVTRDTYEDFADGKEIVVSAIAGKNLNLASENAARYIGLPYNLFSENCEHFVRFCHGLVKESHQMQRYILIAGGIAVGAKSKNSTISTLGYAGALGAFLTPAEKNPIKLILVFVALAGAIIAASA